MRTFLKSTPLLLLLLLAGCSHSHPNDEQLKGALRNACHLRSIELLAYEVKSIGPTFYEGDHATTTFQLNLKDDFPDRRYKEVISDCRADLRRAEDGWYITHTTIPGWGDLNSPVYVCK